jgi:hypothetical protein
MKGMLFELSTQFGDVVLANIEGIDTLTDDDLDTAIQAIFTNIGQDNLQQWMTNRLGQATIDAVPCDLVLVGTPFDLSRLIRTRHPMIRVNYSLDQEATAELARILDRFLETVK